ncbi:MAG: helicase C-terminal domain-containing protein, partial [Cyanobacteria bacterium J06648_11]
EAIEHVEIQLFQAFARRPLPSFLLHTDERAMLAQLSLLLNGAPLPEPWPQWQQLQAQSDAIAWVERNLETGQFILHLAPADVSEILAARVWSTQPVVAIGEALDAVKTAPYFRKRLGLPEGTALRFLPDRRDAVIRVCTPSTFPAPHSPLFRDRAIASLKHLLCDVPGAAVVWVSDRPLQSQIGTALAAEFGSRVRVNAPFQAPNGIGVCSWDYWLAHQSQLPAPTVAIAVTLPFPSMETPWVAGRVAHLKRHRQDWFRTYLLPAAISTLQRAIGSLRSANGTLIVLDSRVTTRSYGEQILDSLTPALPISERQVLASFAEIDSLGEPQSAPVTEYPEI